MKWALLEIALGVACILGWVCLLGFSVLRLAGVLEVDGRTALNVTFALLPLALGFPVAPDMIGRGMRELAPGIITIIGVVLVWALTLPLLDRITGWVMGATDRITERATKA